MSAAGGAEEKRWKRMIYHDDDTFDAVGESFIAALLPIVGRLGLLAEHHCRAMGEKVYWGET